MQILADVYTVGVLMAHKQNNTNFKYRVVGLFNSAWAPKRIWPRLSLREANKTLGTIDRNRLFVSGQVERWDGKQWVEVQS